MIQVLDKLLLNLKKTYIKILKINNIQNIIDLQELGRRFDLKNVIFLTMVVFKIAKVNKVIEILNIIILRLISHRTINHPDDKYFVFILNILYF